MCHKLKTKLFYWGGAGVFFLLIDLLVRRLNFILPPHAFWPFIMEHVFPMPHVNGFVGPEPLIYILVYAAMGALFCLWSAVDGKGAAKDLFRKLMALVIVVSLIQWVSNGSYFWKIHDVFGPQTIEQRRRHMDGAVYEYTRQVQGIMNDFSCRGKLITDMDLTVDPGLYTQRLLAYVLYPIVNMRSYDQTLQPDCLVFFRKHNARQLVPQGFIVKVQLDEERLLAVRGAIDE